jgi:hypothetical protein
MLLSGPTGSNLHPVCGLLESAFFSSMERRPFESKTTSTAPP